MPSASGVVTAGAPPREGGPSLRSSPFYSPSHLSTLAEVQLLYRLLDVETLEQLAEVEAAIAESGLSAVPRLASAAGRVRDRLEPALMDAREAAAFLRQSLSWVRVMTTRGLLPSRHVGRNRRYVRAELLDWAKTSASAARTSRYSKAQLARAAAREVA